MAGGTLPPCGRENSPYRHAANIDSISTPELGEFFDSLAGQPVCPLCELNGEPYLLTASVGRPDTQVPRITTGAL
jgi:hypothetical protein